jgi:hypothetical protein
VRRWLAATAIAVVIMLVIGVPTVLVPTPWFGREIEVTWWSWPVLLATAALSGLLAATYVRADAAAPAAPAAPAPTADDDAGATTSGRLGVAGGLLAYLAVGCPVCNKVALLALGYTRGAAVVRATPACSRRSPWCCSAGRFAADWPGSVPAPSRCRSRLGAAPSTSSAEQ